MQRDIDQTSDHVIICGYGQVGEAIAEAIGAHGERVVVIDRREGIHELCDHPTVRGDATDDNVLVAAGIDRARGLVTALDSDAGNVFVTISARTLKPSLYIVSRANEPGTGAKLQALSTAKEVWLFAVTCG